MGPSRANLAYILRGELVLSPTAEQLRSLGPGDCARLRPAPSKADPWALVFGNALIYLPYLDDPLNAAKSLADMELRVPCPADKRRSTPLFVLDDGLSLDHAAPESRRR